MVKTALIGAGYWGSKLQTTLDKIPNCSVEQVLDIKQNQSINDLNQDIEAVVIATPAWEHYQDVIKSLAKNLHVYVEKPMCITHQEAQDIVSKCTDKKFMVGHIFLYNDCVRKIKKVIDVSKIKYIEIERQNWGRYQYKISPIQSFAPHDFAILDYWLGDFKLNNIAVKGNMITQTAQPDHIDAWFKCNNINVSMRYSWACPSKIRIIRIHEETKVIEYNDVEHRFTITDPTMYKGRFNYGAHMSDVTISNHEPLEEEMKHFFECIVKDKPVLSDQHNGLKITKLTDELDRALIESMHQETPNP